MFFGNIAIVGSSLRTKIFTKFFEMFFDYRDKEYLATIPKKITIRYACKELWGKMLFLMDGGNMEGYLY